MKQYFPKSQLIAIGLVGIHCLSTYINTNIKKCSSIILVLTIYPYKTTTCDLSQSLLITNKFIIATPFMFQVEGSQKKWMPKLNANDIKSI